MNVGDEVMFRAYPGRTHKGVIAMADEVTQLVVVRWTGYFNGEMTLSVVNKADILSDADIKALEVRGLRSQLSAWIEDTTDEGIMKATELLKGLMTDSEANT